MMYLLFIFIRLSTAVIYTFTEKRSEGDPCVDIKIDREYLSTHAVKHYDDFVCFNNLLHPKASIGMPCNQPGRKYPSICTYNSVCSPVEYLGVSGGNRCIERKAGLSEICGGGLRHKEVIKCGQKLFCTSATLGIFGECRQSVEGFVLNE